MTAEVPANITPILARIRDDAGQRQGVDRGAMPFADVCEVIRVLQPTEPVYCMHRQGLRRKVDEFRNGFPGQVCFAVKANPDASVLATLRDADIDGFDVASLDEIERVNHIAPEAMLLYDNPVKSRHEIETAYHQFQVRSFAIDDPPELDKILAIVDQPDQVQLSVRFKLPGSAALHDLSRKFGADELAAARLLRRVAAAGFRPALTFHPGSQCLQPGAYAEHIHAAARIARIANADLTMLNVGGGFPAPYIDSPAPPLDMFFAAIREAFETSFDTPGCELLCEPGRALVAESASLLCRVKHRRAEPVLFINDGIYGGFMEQLLTPLRLPTRTYRDGEPVPGPLGEFVVFGPTCDSTDRFPQPLQLPLDIREGDWIEFGLMGGYGSASATRFNGFASERYVEVAKGF